MSLAEEFYKDNIERNIKNNTVLSKKVKFIGWSRLIVIILLALLYYISYVYKNFNLALTSTIFFIGIFLILVYYHNNLFKKKRTSDILIYINKKGIERLNGEFKNFKDNGSEYLDEQHSFINDLDVFGNNSLFQFMNSTITQGGRDKLVNILKGREKINKTKILERQEAIKELSKKIEWRQKLIVEGSLEKSKNIELEKLIEWSKETESANILRIAIAGTFMFVTFGCIYGSIRGLLPQSFILLVLMVNYLVTKILAKGIKSEISLFESIKNNLKAYSRILNLIEDEKFEASYLKNLKNKLTENNNIQKEFSDELEKKVDVNKSSCKEEMKKLSNMLDWLGDSAYNAYYLLLNVFFFSDVFLMRGLEKWRQKNGAKLEIWLQVMHEIDALCSISNLPFEHEEWSFPTILNKNEIQGINIAHPFLGERAVKNTFSLIDEQKVSLITGSNMSGKSTFLRTVGVNLILSYIGAPVYAQDFSCGIMKIYTCMRTKDNLEESISSFYAEILRIKLLIEACKNGEKVFFILDEIFKGTNSKDRHTGATVLIKQLIEYGGVGLVSTHDLELCDLEKENKSIINYNFREFYENNEIKFDYILREGKSETQNAIHLMKLAGIEIN